ncbi:MAG: DUF5666 domain-containing protein [Candidatus Cryosericum sp.]|nr:DUF5666 domain-containing protein [Candidatus Cryosericum sp.]HPS69946.1 DUF5666 domain-containing protein [Candidatus Cryosericum sp.]
MEHDDREYSNMLNEGLRGVEPSDELHAKVRDRIARGVMHTRRRNTALGTVAVLIVATMVLGSVTPAFGRNGTLPQVINAMAAERQAQKITKTLGTATVQQTSAALLIPEATVQAVAGTALSETDSILALVIADRAGKPIGDVVALRTQGLGWGVIMAQLGISGRDISEAVGQAQAVALANTPSTPPQGNAPSGQPAVSNKNGDKVVVSGEIALVPPVSPISITVAGETFAIGTDTQMKHHGKAITAAEIFTRRAAGMLYATVQGTELADTSLHANLVIVQDGATEVPSTPSAVTPPGEQPKTSNEQQARGKVLIVTSTMLHIDGYAHDIILNTATKVEQVGAGTSTLADIKVGQTVQVHVSVSGTTCTATQVHIEDKAVKPGTSTPTPPQGSGTTPEQPSVSNKTGDKVVVNGVITAASPASLTVAGKTFAITADTQMKYHGKAITPADLVTRFLAGKLAATVQGTELADTSLRANLVIVQDAPDSTPQEGTEQPEPDPSVQTWQGTIAAVFPPAGSDLGAVLVSAAAGQPVLYRMTSTSVLQGTKANGGHYALTLAALQALPTTPPQAVTIEGKLLADGTVAIVKLTVTTVSTTAVTEPTNPGKGKGNDKPGKN